MMLTLIHTLMRYLPTSSRRRKNKHLGQNIDLYI